MREVLFTGYAPVHFLCFAPLARRLEEAGVRVIVSGGLRSQVDGEARYDLRALYDRFGVPRARQVALDALEPGRFALGFLSNTKLIAPGAARESVQVFHGVSFRNRMIREANAAHDHYFLAGPYMRRRFGELGLMPPGDPRGLSIGFMKTDALLDGSLDRDVTRRRLGVDGRRPVILVAPTGAQHNAMETIGVRAIEALRDADRFDVLIKLHDHPHEPVHLPPELLGPHVRLVAEDDVVPLLHAADLLITDASSVASEFALLDRPIVFLDVPELLAALEQVEGSAHDLVTHGRRVGDIVDDPGALPDAVARALDEAGRHSALRRELARDLFYHPAEATAAGLAWTLERLG